MLSTQWVSFITAVGIASWVEFAPVTAFSCSLGREPNPKENDIIRWVMPLNHRLRCQCTSIYPGGFNSYTPDRGFDPFYTDRPLFTDLKDEIFNYFECENCSLTCGNGRFLDDPCHCLCDPNWTGKTCTECELAHCENGGTPDVTTCTCTCMMEWMGTPCNVRRNYDCQDYYKEAGNRKSGVYTIYPSKYPEGLEVFCDMEYWPGSIVIQRRENLHLDFNRGWYEYRDGFGNITGKNFWLGNEKVRQLTEDDENTWQIEFKVRVSQLEYFSCHNVLNNFRLSGENYTVHVDSPLSCTDGDVVLSANGKPFSTSDRDNDGDSRKNCALETGGGWWFNGCSGRNSIEFNLNAKTIADLKIRIKIKRTT